MKIWWSNHPNFEMITHAWRFSPPDVPTSKTASLPQLWSPETDRTHSGPQPSQSSLKKPAFNLSVFGTSSNVSLSLGRSKEEEELHGLAVAKRSNESTSFFIFPFGLPLQSTFNNTVLNSSQLGDSPFYPGKTTYGGAAAVRSVRNRPGTPYQVSTGR